MSYFDSPLRLGQKVKHINNNKEGIVVKVFMDEPQGKWLAEVMSDRKEKTWTEFQSYLKDAEEKT